eukprot:COSAG02_NODE_36297_length_456_cov_1.154062_1_plen_73_part_10
MNQSDGLHWTYTGEAYTAITHYNDGTSISYPYCEVRQTMTLLLTKIVSSLSLATAMRTVSNFVCDRSHSGRGR